jgi:hypothetical protein
VIRPFLSLALVSLVGASWAFANASVRGQDLLSPSAKEVLVEPGESGLVVIFMSSHCPCSNSHASLVSDLAREFKKFNFVVVHSNSDESIDEARTYFAKVNMGIPVIQDRDDVLANQFKALKTPHAFVLNSAGKLVFRGGVTSSNYGPTADRAYLREALQDLTSGHSVRFAEARTLGCLIQRSKRSL